VTGLALASLGILAVVGQVDGRAAPGRADVEAAYLEFLNIGCGESGDDCHHPLSTAIRRVRCTPGGDNRSRCRFEQRTQGFYVRRPRWQRAEFDFVYDGARARWAMDCRTESTQAAGVSVIRCN
jgi:hypothetical protein